MENVQSLAKKINLTNKAMLALIKEAGLSHSLASDEVSQDDQNVVIAYIKSKREKNTEKKPKLTLSKPVATLGGTQKRILHKRNTLSTTSRNIAKQNALDERERELAQQRIERQKQKQDQAELEKQQQIKEKQEENNKQVEQVEKVEKAEEAEIIPITKPTLIKKSATESKPALTSPQKKAEDSPLKEPRSKSAISSKPSKKRSKASNKSMTLPVSKEIVQLNEFVRGQKNRQNQTIREPMKSNLLSQEFTKPAKSVTKEIQINETIVVSELAHLLACKANVLIKELMKLGSIATINQSIDFDTAVLVADELGHTVIRKQTVDIKQQLEKSHLSANTKPRSPVVTVMGHVDHGKTSLLDYIRSTRVVDKESGGITQHIGAYHVQTSKGAITFLDTPGHAAFTSMRARGALMTDIVVLVVACDDKVMPQTIEAIEHAKSAEVPIVVALNKIDRPEADPERLINELSAYELIPEDWGGDTQFARISALHGEGIDSLLDSISLQSEMLELTAVSEGQAKGTVIESRLDKHRGPVASVLVQQGILNKGDHLLVGTSFGRLRAMYNDQGKEMMTASASIPVEILGLNYVPEAGDDLQVVDNEKTARDLAQVRNNQRKQDQTMTTAPLSIEDAFNNLEQEQKVLNLVVKADTRGSIEAIKHSLKELDSTEAKVNLIIAGTGGITETDITLAQATSARVVGFHVRADNKARNLSEKTNIRISYYSVIYELIDDMDNYLNGLLEPVFEENISGTAEVRDIFTASHFGKIAGCLVIEGTIYRNKPIRVIRDDTVIYEGELESLKRFKEDVPQVRSGTECGIGVKGYKDIRVGDRIEVFDRVEVERKRNRGKDQHKSSAA